MKLLHVTAFFCGLVSAVAVEPTRVDSVDPARDSRLSAQPGVVEEISASDLAFYGLATDETTEGGFEMHASLVLDAYYDSNVFLDGSGEVDDFIWELRPKLWIENTTLGESVHYFSLYYDPDFIFFTDLSDEDSINQSGGGEYVFTGDKLTFSLGHRSAEIEGANFDINRRTNRQEHTTNLRAEYQLTSKVLLEASAVQALRFFDELRNFHSWTGEAFALYEVLPKVRVGLGSKFGWVDIEDAPNQSFQQALLRIRYDPSPKLSFTGNVGAEFRQYQDPFGVDDRITPAVSLGMVWTPYDSTTFTLTGYRNVSPSNTIIGSNFVASGFRASIRQRFFQKYFYTLSGGYENADYRPTLRGTTNDRIDDYLTIKNALDYDFWEYGSVQLYHLFEQNFTNSLSDFVRQQVGVQLTFEY